MSAMVSEASDGELALAVVPKTVLKLTCIPLMRAGLEFVKAMWGCLFAGIVAVPLAPPNPLALKQALPPFNRILKDSGAVAILTDGDFNNWVSDIPVSAT